MEGVGAKGMKTKFSERITGRISERSGDQFDKNVEGRAGETFSKCLLGNQCTTSPLAM